MWWQEVDLVERRCGGGDRILELMRLLLGMEIIKAVPHSRGSTQGRGVPVAGRGCERTGASSPLRGGQCGGQYFQHRGRTASATLTRLIELQSQHVALVACRHGRATRGAVATSTHRWQLDCAHAGSVAEVDLWGRCRRLRWCSRCVCVRGVVRR